MKSPNSLTPEHILFDRASVRLHRDRAARIDWPTYSFLFEEVANRLAERLLDITSPFETALDLGCRGGEFSKKLVEMKRVKQLVKADLSYAMVAETKLNAVVADEEFLPFKARSFDLVGSVLGLHWTNDLPGALAQIAKILRPNGLFLGALFGVGSLQELKGCLSEAESEIKGGVSPRISPFTEVRDAGALLQRAGFALPVTDMDMITLKYPDPFSLMRELRGLGESNALVSRQKTFTGRKILIRAAELYTQQFADEDGRIPASFQIIYMAGWSPHDSQQKPMARGSGRHNLKDILGS
ncbi:methyltransferase domain-containing protein [Sneathiella sp.]|uniref:methyltransferase domain-containing protein n=1 Tax=Sneathiella sp. TaxID=1964365 RepID=UPI00356865E0